MPTTITVAISTDPEVMQNAAERMLGLTMDDKQNLITDVVYGQMRMVIADMTIEELNSDRIAHRSVYIRSAWVSRTGIRSLE